MSIVRKMVSLRRLPRDFTLPLSSSCTLKEKLQLARKSLEAIFEISQAPSPHTTTSSSPAASKQSMMLSALTRQCSCTRLIQYRDLPFSASDLVPALEASTVPKMKRMVRSGGRFPWGATVTSVTFFGLPTAWTFEPNEGIRHEFARLMGAID